MYSFSGLVNGNTIKVDDNLQTFDGCRVIITILDESSNISNQATSKILDSKRMTAVRELAGIWKNRKEDVDGMVRNLRRGRSFDL